MKVGELKDIIKDIDNDLDIFIASDLSPTLCYELDEVKLGKVIKVKDHSYDYHYIYDTKGEKEQVILFIPDEQIGN